MLFRNEGAWTTDGKVVGLVSAVPWLRTMARPWLMFCLRVRTPTVHIGCKVRLPQSQVRRNGTSVIDWKHSDNNMVPLSTISFTHLPIPSTTPPPPTTTHHHSTSPPRRSQRLRVCATYDNETDPSRTWTVLDTTQNGPARTRSC